MPRGRKKGDGRGRLGGRAKDTPNKTTKEMRELLSNFCQDNFERFVERWKRIEDDDKACKIYLDAQAFVTPKLSSVELKDKLTERTFADELDELEKD